VKGSVKKDKERKFWQRGIPEGRVLFFELRARAGGAKWHTITLKNTLSNNGFSMGFSSTHNGYLFYS
jgi:hypothetical protein